MVCATKVGVNGCAFSFVSNITDTTVLYMWFGFIHCHTVLCIKIKIKNLKSTLEMNN